MPTADDNKALVRRYVDEIWNRGDTSRAIEFVAEDVAVHAPPFPDGVGIDALTGVAAAFRAALPDLVVEADVIAADGDTVMHHFILTGTHTGAPLLGAEATGHALSTSGVTMFRVTGGRIAASEGLLDAAGLMGQLHPAEGTEP